LNQSSVVAKAARCFRSSCPLEDLVLHLLRVALREFGLDKEDSISGDDDEVGANSIFILLVDGYHRYWGRRRSSSWQWHLCGGGAPLRIDLHHDPRTGN
jgi:hypothetical protein